tara:strand:+ start:121 stop:393 length:273 start_codon:yes stop_codon:yes gene_type:complete
MPSHTNMNEPLKYQTTFTLCDRVIIKTLTLPDLNILLEGIRQDGYIGLERNFHWVLSIKCEPLKSGYSNITYENDRPIPERYNTSNTDLT